MDRPDTEAISDLGRSMKTIESLVRREDLSGVGGVRRDDQANAAWILGRRYIYCRSKGPVAYPGEGHMGNIGRER